MAAPDWQAIRRRYPAALARPYLDTAVKGLPAPEALAAVEAYCRFVRDAPGASATEDSLALIESLGATRAAAARLIGAEPDEIALVEGTQAGLSVLAAALGLGPGDEVVSADVEFFPAVLPWPSVRLVPARDGRVEVADLEAAIGPRTRAVCVSSVQEASGDRLDLPALSEACRARGVLLVVDAIQHLAAAPLDVRETPVDALAAGGQKWLCSPFGMGFLYVRRSLAETLEPPRPGYMAIAEPPGGWEAYLSDPARRPDDPLPFVRDARRLEPGGTAPYLAAQALTAALGALERIGLPAIHARVAELTGLLIEGLDALGAVVTSPREPGRRAGIVTFRSGGGLAADRALRDALLAAGVAVSLRFAAGAGGIRVSPHLYSDESDVERLLEVVGSRLTAINPE